MKTKVTKFDAEMDNTDLTDKQVQVLQFVCDRRTNKEIALILGISPSAVEQRLQSVRRKFGVHSRAELARAFERIQPTSLNLTGEEYQVEPSVMDGHNSTKYFEDELHHVQQRQTTIQQPTGEIVLEGGDLRSKTNVLDVVDHASGAAGRVAAITTAAAGIALLIILIAEVAPGLS